MICGDVASLQFGHGGDAVENATSTGLQSLTGMASIRPRPFGRGKRHSSVAAPPGSDGLQFGHGLSAVENLTPPAVGECPGRPGFNSATAFRPWKSLHVWMPAGPHASIRPRPFGRGNTNLNGRPPLPLQFGHGLSAVENKNHLTHGSLGLQRFNSATAFRPWKISTARGCLSQCRSLQFGHGCEAVENAGLGRPNAGVRLQFGHGGEAVENTPAGGWPFSFNSATAVMPWKIRHA